MVSCQLAAVQSRRLETFAPQRFPSFYLAVATKEPPGYCDHLGWISADACFWSVELDRGSCALKKNRDGPGVKGNFGCELCHVSRRWRSIWHGGTFVYRDDAQVVDTFADARDRDILNLAEEMEHDLEADKLCLIEKETIL